ncbi:ATP-binding protein [Streptomyces mirabilis]|uniref:ATP-binding protein n=1 Tax=Streptomyces mirabilis TaxID=68239 RepID=UPI0037957E41
MSRCARILVPGEASAVAFARERVLTQMHAWGVQAEEPTRDAIRLVASELLTNAVVHTDSRFLTMGLYYDEYEGRLLLVVHDASPDPPRQQPVTVEDHGRGLELVALLSSRHGWEPTSRGKRVWAEFAVPVPAPATRAARVRLRLRAAAPASGP